MPPQRFPFHCISGCTTSGFRSQRGLSIHQSTCRVYKEDQRRELQELAQAAEAEEEYIRRLASTPATAVPDPPVSDHSSSLLVPTASKSDRV